MTALNGGRAISMTGLSRQFQPAPIDARLFDKWTAYIDAAPRTVETYSRAIRRFVAFLFEKSIRTPQREDVIAYRDHLSADHKPATVQSYLTAVKLFFSWTAQEGLYPNVAERVKGARLDREHKKDSLTSRQVGAVLSSVDRSTSRGKRDYALLALMATTGLRTISVIRANVEDLRSVGDVEALYYQGKGHAERADYVKLAPPVEDAIREYLQVRNGLTGKAPLFGSEARRNKGGRMTTRSISRVVKDKLRAVGLDSDRLTAHSLRHTAATLNLLNGGTVEETQQLLGHRNINTTMIYSHALERMRNDSELRVASAIFGGK